MIRVMTSTKPHLDHPSLPRVKAAFADVKFLASEFRNQSTLVVPNEHLHRVLRFLRDDAECDYNFLSDVTAVDYLGYPSKQPGRFAVVYLLVSYTHNRRITVKTYLDPS